MNHPLFDCTRTGMAHYDHCLNNPGLVKGLLGFTLEVNEMPVDEYLKQCAKFYGKPLSKAMARTKPEKLRRLADLHKAGLKFPMPILNFYKRSQEGWHRTLLAKSLGYNTIPVIIIWRTEI